MKDGVEEEFKTLLKIFYFAFIYFHFKNLKPEIFALRQTKLLSNLIFLLFSFYL